MDLYAASTMIRLLRLLIALIVSAAVVAIAIPAGAQKAEPPPKPGTYLCPHTDGTAIDCYLDAIDHLYTMCRNVKSIEIIEFGYEHSDEGVNGAKTQYCLDKHGSTIKAPFQSAVHEAGKNRAVVEALNSLHDYWLVSLTELKWHPGESDEQYKARTALPYGIFRERAMLVRAALPVPKAKPAAAAPAPKGKPATQPPKTNDATTDAAPAKPKSPS